MEMTFITSVITNSVRPTAKIVLYSIEPVGRSPFPVAPMKAVSVSIGARGSNVSCGSCPTAMSTIIVSPTAREMPSTNEAMMPEIAAGTTTRVETWSRSAPRPYAPSRSACGTADIASSESEAIVGISITPMTRPPARTLKISTCTPIDLSRGVTAVSAK